MNNYPIGIFDSGIGGISILQACRKILPKEHFVYVADNAFAPYGKRTKKTVEKRSVEILRMLINEHNIKALVIACNTASTISAAKLRREFLLPIVAVEPPVKMAKISKPDEKILIMATKHTCRNKHVKLFVKTHKNVSVLKNGELAHMIDKSPLENNEIKPYISRLIKDNNFDKIVLGCTHYNFIKNDLKTLFPNCEVISCENSVALRLKDILKEKKLLSNSQNSETQLILTKKDQTFERKLQFLIQSEEI